ncbi:hypothetical protein FGG08_003680 [Glutinoglossum americanum]|uniref:Armadillo repeat-containing protein 8 n=1 Tax=Glutinoglossum americanum TaxID=1670608 RepID=A0A9P8I211_9PEZI|nr:hypothetical protein FGG08_003680 [Glutinoglossum americanum]
MTRPAVAPILTQIRNPSSLGSQVSALKALKNELIGHEQKKEMWIGLGIVIPIVHLLGHSKTSGKRRSRELNGTGIYSQIVQDKPDEDEARLQATIIVGSLAYGGPAYVAPLLAAHVLPPLLAQLSIAECSPQIVLAALRTLITIADSLASAHPVSSLSIGALSNALMSKFHVQSLAQILSQTSPAPIVQQQIALAAMLVAKACREERHQNLLANAGVLDALASRLAGFIISMGFGFPGVERAIQGEGNIVGITLSPAPRSAQLPPILEATGAIISDSMYRASQLLYSPAIIAVFPQNSPPDLAPHWATPASPAASRHLSLNPIDYLLPQVPTPQHKIASSQTTPQASAPTSFSLGGPSSRDGILQGSRHASGSHTRLSSHMARSGRLADQTSAGDIPARFGGRASSDEDESPLIAWLLYVTRAESGVARLMAASTLTILYRAKLVNPRRETEFAHLLVPILVKMLGKSSDSQPPGPSCHASFDILDRAPTILASLVTDSVELQKAAVEAQAIKNLSRMLKMAFDPADQLNQPSLWAADSTATNTDHREGSTILLGHSGLPRAIIEKLKLREAALKGLAALAPFRDEYRKMIIENGVTPFIVASMKPFGQISSKKAGESFNGSGYTVNSQIPNVTPNSKNLERWVEGNPPSVLIAACGAVRALSRSVSILRTSLIDAGVAMPLFDLLKSPDMEVKIAATAAVCNLLLEFSPMREAIMDAGVLKLICEHAHSSNPKLRLNAVWALKHLVFSAENKVKVSCLEELGPGWLVQLICDDTEDTALCASDESEEGEGAVEVSTDMGDSYMSVDPEVPQELFGADDESEQGGFSMTDSVPEIIRSHVDCELDEKDAEFKRPRRSHKAVPPTLNARLAALKDAETNPMRKARRDDVAVQEQGLDFIRNLICGQGSTEMIDILFSGLGEDRVFDILASKLRPKVVNAYGRGKRNSPAAEPRVIHPQGEIVVAVCFIIVHIAASKPQHRQLLISQTELLKLLASLSEHLNKNVRAAVAWSVINLTWVDDEADQMSCRKRAIELRKLGFLARLEKMEQDPELDVRERCKTALYQMKTILH